MNASRSAKGAPRANCDRQPERMYQPDGDRRLEAVSGIPGDGVEARCFDLSERPEVWDKTAREKLRRLMKRRDSMPNCHVCFMRELDLARGLIHPPRPHVCNDDILDVEQDILEAKRQARIDHERWLKETFLTRVRYESPEGQRVTMQDVAIIIRRGYFSVWQVAVELDIDTHKGRAFVYRVLQGAASNGYSHSRKTDGGAREYIASVKLTDLLAAFDL